LLNFVLNKHEWGRLKQLSPSNHRGRGYDLPNDPPLIIRRGKSNLVGIGHGFRSKKPALLLYSERLTLGRIIKVNLSWSQTRAKFCQLIASLSVLLLQLKLTKLKLEVLKSDFHRKKERYQHR